MGWNTAILVLNDQLTEIEDCPEEFVERLSCAITYSSANEHEVFIPGQTTVVYTGHADELGVIVIGNNTGTVLGHVHGIANDGTRDSHTEILRWLASAYGYRLIPDAAQQLGRFVFGKSKVWHTYKEEQCCSGQHSSDCANYTGPTRAELDNTRGELIRLATWVTANFECQCATLTPDQGTYGRCWTLTPDQGTCGRCWAQSILDGGK